MFRATDLFASQTNDQKETQLLMSTFGVVVGVGQMRLHLSNGISPLSYAVVHLEIIHLVK